MTHAAQESLPKEQRPTELLPLSQQLSDTVKMIAYRCETAMVAMLRKHLKKVDEARALVRALYVSSGDIEPDVQANTLTIKIHRMATPAHDKALGFLLVPRLSEFDRLEAASLSGMRRCKSSRYLRVSLWFTPSLTYKSIDFQAVKFTETGYWPT